jgi:dihydroorotase/N-acyl-D-amino-acid deacylase
MFLSRAATLLVVICVFPRPAPAQTPRSEFDIIIRRGRIIDGTGSPWYSADLGIRDGKIAAIGELVEAKSGQVIDAQGRVVAPGFIDMLGQSELSILVEPRLPSKIYQGITTEITGEGSSVAPLNDELISGDRDTYSHYHVTPDWHTLRQYFARLEKQGMGINLATYVGATQVRRLVLGDDNVQPAPAQLEQMKELVREAMKDGAVGLSTSLMYAPAPYAKTEELIALASEAARMGGLYATHVRNESTGILPALQEAVRIGREAKIPVEIWHLKVAGKRNWGRMQEVVSVINKARAEGIDVAADTYAYPAWANSLSSYIPPWAHDGGDGKLVERLRDPQTRARLRTELITPSSQWDNEWDGVPGPEAILIGQVQNPKLQTLVGKTLAQVANFQGKDPLDALFDLLIEDKGFTRGISFGMNEADIVLALQQPWVSFDNDYEGVSPDGLLAKDYVHPRAYGTFPRVLRQYVREQKKLSLEDALRKFSGLPAQRMRLADRGVLKIGLWADVVVFDPESIRDRATFEQPHQLSEGMEYVLVNGVPVIAEGKMTGALPGKVLRGPAWRP